MEKREVPKDLSNSSSRRKPNIYAGFSGDESMTLRRVAPSVPPPTHPGAQTMRGTASPDTLAAHLAELILWSARTPLRPRLYAPAELEQALGRRMRALAQPLVLAGWSRVISFSRKSGTPACRVHWAPPGYPLPRPTRGRPPFNLELLGVFE